MESMLHPDPEFVQNIRYRVKENNGWCLYCQNKNNKANKCPKACKRRAENCMCGMYINVDNDSNWN